MIAEFGRLLQAIGVQPTDRVTVCHKVPGGAFAATDGTAEDAPRRAAALAGRADVWFGVCPLRPAADLGDTGRGTVQDIARIPALWADLDAKPAPAGLGSPDGCTRVVEALSGILRAQPVAVVGSGTGGLHPYWRLEYASRDHVRAVRLLRRWGVLVRAVAASSGGGADNVFDSTRVLRVPGTRNLKADGGTVTVTFTEDDAGTEVDVLTLDQVEEALDLAGVRDEPVRDSAGPTTPMAEWATTTSTCSYTRRMIDGWATDRPASGRHQWLLGQAVRLAAARRLGCIATTDVPRAHKALTAAFRRVLASGGPTREEAPYELQGALQWGVGRVEAMTEDQARAELASHVHRVQDPRIDPVTGEYLGDEPDGHEPPEPDDEHQDPPASEGPDPLDVLDREIRAVLAARGPDRWHRFEQARRTLDDLVARGLLTNDQVEGELAALGEVARHIIVPLAIGSDRAFPVHVLPEGMAAAVREVAAAVQVDPAIPATGFLGAAAGAVGARTRVVITETWSRWANLYLAVVAESGDGKSPGFAPALEPLEVLGDRLRDDAAEVKRRAQVMLPVLKQQLSSMQRGSAVLADMMVVQESLDEAEATLARDARAVVDDVTPERLAQLLADNEGVLTAWNDEGALLAHMLGLYASTPNLDVFLKAWDGSTLTIDRKGSNGTPGACLVVKDPRLTVVAAVQPAVIGKLGEPRHRDLIDRGVVGRLLMAWPGSTAGTRMLSGRDSVPYQAVPAWNTAVAGMLSTHTTQVVFDPQARKVFLDWHDKVEAALPLGRAYADIRPFAVKVRDAVPRLAGLFARLEDRRVVTAAHVGRGIELGEYYLTHAEAVVESWAGSHVGVARKILARLQGEATRSHCDQCPDGVGYVFHVRDAQRWGRVSSEDTIGALEVLEQHGYVRPADPEEGYGEARRKVGKRSPHVIANPALFPDGQERMAS